MLFPTFTFAAFFAIVYTLHVLLRTRIEPWKFTMVAASAVFYGWWDWRFCGLIAGSIVANWAIAKFIPGPACARIAVVTNLGVLGFFKYYNFFASSFNDLGSGASLGNLPLANVVLPVGISFFTFQALSYVIDVSQGKLKPAPLLDVAVYLSFFPQLVAGPIVRASEFLPQLQRKEQPSQVQASEAMWLIGRGLFKKVVVSTYLANTIVDPTFTNVGGASRPELWASTYGYAIQIYADFSGYTDIAIGLALLLGFRFPENFDNPYRARSIQDFWRRWHKTLSRWLRDYLYIPLGGNRQGQVATYRNLMLTMVLGGLWHGANWTFIIWGLLHGTALSIERLASRRASSAPAITRSLRSAIGVRPIRAIQWFTTFHVVCLAWIFFRADSFTQALEYLNGLFSAPSGGEVRPLLIALIVGALALQLAPTTIGAGVRYRLDRVHPLVQSAFFGAWLALIVALGPDGISPFIYFQF